MPYSLDALAGKAILLAEDDYLLASTIEAAVRSAGGIVQGPFASVGDALHALATGAGAPDGATLNIRLADGDSYPVADELVRRAIPFVFASGNGAASLPGRFAKAPMVPKPYSAVQVVQALAALLHDEGAERAGG